MGPKTRAPDYSSAPDAKHLLDMIGKDVHEKAKSEAKNYIEELKGDLNTANGRSSETRYTTDTCTLVKEYYTTRLGVNNERNPCKGLSGIIVERFSDTLGGQCTDHRIKGNNRNVTGGACAPYRRLHVCDKNMEKIPTSKTSTDTLLAEVCYAAKYEGDSISGRYRQHQLTNKGSQLCTVLARSFADIGDIVRGRDLYLGYDDKEKEKRDQLESKLKVIFGNIYGNLDKNNRYNDDTPEYYKLREAWWDANRAKVWEAITCDAPDNAKYFRGTCGGDDEKTGTQAIHKCRCTKSSGGKPGKNETDQVPTYFDYVPQFLRWFEEWAEDFCRKKKHKLKDVKTNCRNDEEQRYCSGNGFDCTKTIYKKGRIVIGEHCTKCSVWCRMYESWIDNQKKEFLKQKRKYKTEISGGDGGGSSRKKRVARSSSSSDDNGYESKFYKKLKEVGYQDVDSFLEKLNNEEICKKITDEKENIDFKTADNSLNKNINKEGTFYHSKYCEVCPGCGVERNGSGWEEKSGGTCDVKKPYKIRDDAPFNDINVLSFGDKGNEIKQKIDKFCKTQNGNSGKASSSGSGDCGTNIDSSLCEPWKCYKGEDVMKPEDDDDQQDYENMKNAGGLCILPNPKKHESEKKTADEPAEFQKTYNDFFYFWIRRFLNDSMYWRGKIGGCLKNKSEKCKNECNTNCDCFKKWIGKKKEEWDKIKKHFKTQDFGSKGFLGQFGYDEVLKYVLNIDELFKDIKDGYGNAKELEGIKKLLEEEERKNQVEAADGGASSGKDNTTIDKLLKHEEQDATKCKDCKPPEESLARAEVAGDNIPKKEDSDEEEEEEEEGTEGTGEVEENVEEDNTENKDQEDVSGEGSKEAEKEPTAKKDEAEKVCETVKSALTGDDLTKACQQKYQYGKEKFPNWKCIPSGDKTDTSSESESPPRQRRDTTSGVVTTAPSSAKSGDTTGSICVPPRRRKLYIGKIKEWAGIQLKSQVEGGGTGKQSSQLQQQQQQQQEQQQQQQQLKPQSPVASNSTLTTSAKQSPSNPRADDLRDAFIQSAAIETFFLWHRYKKIKEKEKKEKQEEAQGNVYTQTDENKNKDPQNELNGGKIPDGFLRQMFYTLADYKDILEGKNIVVDMLSGNDKDTMKKIQAKIDEILPKNGTSPGSSSGNDPESWWKNHGEHIWNAMVCALTYTDSEAKEQPPIQDKEVKKALLDKEGASNEPISQYQYKTVELKEESSDTKPQIASAPSDTPTLNNPKLTEFVEIPPFFRWLHEWGSDFCDKRARMLKNVKKACREKGDDEYKCSGDGHDCTKNGNLGHHKMLEDPNCPRCYEQCRKYRKWIDIKFEEFHNQKHKYQGEYDKLKVNSSVDYKKLQGYSTAADFLKELRHCKDGQTSEEKDNDNKIDFKEPLKTFGHSKYCEMCPSYEVNCNGRRARSGGNDQCTPVNGNGNTWDSVFEGISGNGENSTITVEMIDRRGPFIKEYSKDLKNSEQSKDSNDLFKTSRLFKGIRKQEWTCKYKGENMDLCKLNNFNKVIDLNDYTTFKVLLIYWLEDFIEGYYILKKRKVFEQCKENGGNKCSEESKKNCACVKVWVDQKKEEWDQIRTHFNNRNQRKGDDDMKSSVKKILDPLIYRMDLKNGKRKFDELTDFLKAYECKCVDNAGNSEKDVVECLLENLKTKATSCQTQHQPSGKPGQTCENPITPPDDEDLVLEEEQNPENMRPGFCPPQTPAQQEETDGTCDAVAPGAAKKAEEESGIPPAAEPEADKGPEQADTEKKVPPKAAPARPKDKKRPKRQPRNVLEHPAVIPALMSSTIMWSIGIGFAAFTYFYLKKKTKSTIDLLRVINIPKSDYDIPTKLSPNRYIPYTSGKYRGKRYIYLEGYSGTDSGYTDHYSDITSSSESEYEEMDINDIYVPRAPKYKTLIEVVLEPSGKNTTASGKNTPIDTQNDIQSDGIPSSKITDNEWNTLKDEFISHFLQSEQPNDVPNDYSSGDIPFNTQPNTLYFDKPEEKPFITSIHDRNLLSGEEYSYDMSTNTMDDPKYVSNNVYSGIDLINDSLNSGNEHIDIYDELLKRKENELFGTNHVKQTSIHSVAKPISDDPIHNQLNLFHTWLDRQRDMCQQWNNKEEVLDKLKEKWENETHSGDINSGIPSGKLSDIPSDNNIHMTYHTC
ncbi:hypothetical protein PFNF54_00349 [Plasmodium falciparum NF54]|uniref:Erythrocyte membrane protein 1 n=1 Tax=Plasmodium falciparum (isolate NF54) TaxID=5843 RepID=W7K0C1_PLAFO|nr:hypothetical protein PFNF54_00349 [Plasmodium falciparum NF54]